MNESGGANESYLSLDSFKIFVGGATDPALLPTSVAGLQSQFGAAVYDLDAGGDNTVLIDGALQSGSGSSDIWIFVPVADFGAANADDLVYIYASLGGYAGAIPPSTR